MGSVFFSAGRKRTHDESNSVGNRSLVAGQMIGNVYHSLLRPGDVTIRLPHDERHAYISCEYLIVTYGRKRSITVIEATERTVSVVERERI